MSEEKNKKAVYKPKPVSGFPEWLPEVRLVEQQWLDHIRRVFESYGFCSIETPSVEELDVIAAKGEVDKEIYVLERLHREDGDKDARLALHFDQTVPLARYTAQHFNDLVFPFKRYQMQRVWRGERPQAGRFREFTQCDIDVINVDALPLHFDAEMPAIVWEVLNGLPGMEGEKIQIRVSNRKILMGYFATAHPTSTKESATHILRMLDKLEKVSQENWLSTMATVFQQVGNINFGDTGPKDIKQYTQEFLGAFSEKYSDSNQLGGRLKANPVFQQAQNNAVFREGVEELCFTLDNLRHLPPGSVVADLSIVRGLDYYTGTVYETVFTDNPGYGSICSGGRYDDLASQYINKKLPGVGISIGFSRLFAYLLEQGKLPVARKSPAHVLMVLPSEEQRGLAAETARTLRQRGVNVELYHAPKKTGDQIKYADRKGIPYIWFPDLNEVKCMKSGTQAKADPANWEPEEG